MTPQTLEKSTRALEEFLDGLKGWRATLKGSLSDDERVAFQKMAEITRKLAELFDELSDG